MESINTRVAKYPNPTDNNFAIFKTYAATVGSTNLQASWNPDCWGASVNLSPIAWHDNWTNADGAGPTLGQGIAVTKRHILAHHQHGTEAPGRMLQFLRQNGQVLTRQTAAEYEIDSSTYWRVLWLTEDLPDDMVAPMPSADSNVLNKPIVSLNQFREMRLQWVYNHSASQYGVSVNNAGAKDPDPIRAKYHRSPISGDSGKPLFAIIGNELVPVSVWWTTGGGTSVIYHQASILAAIDKLSTAKGDMRMLKPRLVQIK
jgi:hypothetical protein